MTMVYSVRDGAAELGVGQGWLYQRAARGEVEHQRYGRAIRFTAEQIEKIRQQYAQQVVTPRRLRSTGRAA